MGGKTKGVCPVSARAYRTSAFEKDQQIASLRPDPQRSIVLRSRKFTYVVTAQCEHSYDYIQSRGQAILDAFKAQERRVTYKLRTAERQYAGMLASLPKEINGNPVVHSSPFFHMYGCPHYLTSHTFFEDKLKDPEDDISSNQPDSEDEASTVD